MIQKHASAKPTIIFCATRKDTSRCAKEIAKSYSESDKAAWKVSVPTQANFRDKELNELVPQGVAFHHAGLDMVDRNTVERLFLAGRISVITATSTLAVGVNLPAHLVVIKNTLTYVGGSFEEYSDLEILQMIGRAGRPQFDDSGTAVILTEQEKVARYQNLVSGTDKLESYLHDNLLEHINAEIGLGTFKDVPGAIRWLKSTFLYVRIKDNPNHYHVQGLNLSVDEHLEMLCEKDISLLKEHDLIRADGNQIKITAFGDAMAKYYVRFVTMCHILDLPPKSSTDEILVAACKAEELVTHRFRGGEKPFYNELKKNEALRYTFQGKTDEIWQKVMLLAQLDMCSIDLTSLKEKFRDVLNNIAIHKASIRLQLLRLLSCVIDCKLEKQDAIAVFNALELRRSFAAKCWEHHPSMLKQLTGIGEGSLRTLLAAGITSFDQLRATDPRELEKIFKRNPPFGNGILKDLASFPNLKMHITLTNTQQIKSGIELIFSVRLMCENQPRTKRGGHPHHIIFLADTVDGVLLDFRRQSVHRITDGVDLPLKVHLKNFTTGLRFRLMCEELVGNMLEEVYNLSLQPTDFPTIQEVKKLPMQQINSCETVQPMLRNENIRVPATQLSDNDYIDIFDDDETLEKEFRHVRTKNLPDVGTDRTKEIYSCAKSELLLSGRQACNHHCKDKSRCGHLCCKDGIARARHKMPKRQESVTPRPGDSLLGVATPPLPSTKEGGSSYGTQLHSLAQERAQGCLPLQDIQANHSFNNSFSRIIDLSGIQDNNRSSHSAGQDLRSKAESLTAVQKPFTKRRTPPVNVITGGQPIATTVQHASLETSDQAELPNLSDIVHNRIDHTVLSVTNHTKKDAEEIDDYGWDDIQFPPEEVTSLSRSPASGKSQCIEEVPLTSALFVPTSPETPQVTSKVLTKPPALPTHQPVSTIQKPYAAPSLQQDVVTRKITDKIEPCPDLSALDFLGDCFFVADDDNDENDGNENGLNCLHAHPMDVLPRTRDPRTTPLHVSGTHLMNHEAAHYTDQSVHRDQHAALTPLATQTKDQQAGKRAYVAPKRPFATAFPQNTIVWPRTKAPYMGTTGKDSPAKELSQSTSSGPVEGSQTNSFLQLFTHTQW